MMAEVKNTEEQTPKPTEKAASSAQTKKGVSNKNLLIIVGIVGVGIIVFAAVGLNYVRNKITDKAATTTASGIIGAVTGGKVSVDSSGKDVTIKTADGSTYSSSQKLPTDWPTSVPLYSPYTVTGSYKASTDGKTAWHLATTTTDSYSKVTTDLPKQYSGWTNGSSYEANGGALYSYENDTYNVIVSVAQPDSTSNNQVVVSYTVTQK